MRSLVLCQACKRHVKMSETQCPFCSAALHPPRRQAAVRARGFAGGRAALFLAGTALAPGCVEEPEPDLLDNQNDDAGSADAMARDAGKDGTDAMAVAVYGVAIDPRRDGGLIAVPYGIAVPLDAGAKDSGATDAGCPQVGNLPVPVYGIPVDSGTRTDQCKDAGQDAGKDAGVISLPPYGVAIDAGLIAATYGVAIDAGK